MEAAVELDDLIIKVKAIAQGANADLLVKFVDLLYEEESLAEPEQWTPEDLAAIEAGLKASVSGDRSQFISLEEYERKHGL